MNVDTQTLVAAVEAGEMTDSGAMTTTEDVTHVVTDSYSAVDERLHSLADDDIVACKMFGNEEVWVVVDDTGQPAAKTPMPTDTRVPDAGG